MTSPDPSTNSADDTQTRLRVGGWLPPYEAFPPSGGPMGPPLVYRSQQARNVDTRYELSTPTKNERRRSAAVFCAAVACLLMIGVALTQLGERPTASEASEVLLPAAPMMPPAYAPPSGAGSAGPIYGLPINGLPPTRATSRPPTTEVGQRLPPDEAATTPARKPTTAPATTKPRPRPKPEPAGGTTPPASPGLRIGAPVSLEVSGAPGLLVRHYDFRARVDRIGPNSPAVERADARFVVRRGLADDDCVSFESSNYPGRFLRHRNFEIRLDRSDRTRLFDQDATFCPETLGGAGVVVLRSDNYPDRFVTESRSLLRLSPATTGTATRFVVRPPL